MVEQHRVKAQEAAHSPTEGSDADVLMGEVAADAEDVAAEPVVSGVPFPMEGSRSRRRRRNSERGRQSKKRRRQEAARAADAAGI